MTASSSKPAAREPVPSQVKRESSTGGPAVMYQKWRDLLFLHWETDPTIIQKTLPPGLRVDTFSGRAYLGVVPFRMEAVRPRFLPAVPGLSAFPELNLRTYVVDAHGHPGVWFYSLDAGHGLAVWIARTLFHLPYHRARMSCQPDDTGHTRFWSRRGDGREQVFRYRAAGTARPADPGSLEAFLVERYVLYSWNPRRACLYRGQVSHRPYAIAPAEVPILSRELFSLNGFVDPMRAPDHQVASAGVDVTIHPLTPA